MKIKEFINFLENEAKVKPNLFLFRDNEPKATIEDINNIEKILSGKLPESFIEFIKYKPNLFLKSLLYIPKIRSYSKLYFSYRFSMELSLFLMSGFSLKTALEVIVEETEFNFFQIFMKLAFNK